ncbi:MAG: twitching motility protein PilT [Lachnospiraceae bacterium]|nr:twitching motility protein PilT [Lachnospiraceae bacterium]
MLQIIAGSKGKGKTIYLLDKANTAIKKTKGTIVYIDKNDKHMHDLSNKIRLIDASEYPIRSYNAFVGFICGIISQDYDLEQLYLDSFLKISHLEGQDIEAAVAELNTIAEKYHLDIILSISVDEKELPENAKDKLIVSL